jgi:DNA invertase Pin-like site-specific DNA recombinase
VGTGWVPSPGLARQLGYLCLRDAARSASHPNVLGLANSRLAERNCDELRRISRFHPHQHRVLVVLAQVGQLLAHVGGLRHRFAGDIEVRRPTVERDRKFPGWKPRAFDNRVSTDGQSIEAQVKQLRQAGAGKVFRETASGARADRPQLRSALAALGGGDVLFVTRLDRLARSTRDLLNTLAAIAERGARFRSLGDAWADTTTAHGRLILTVLGGLAEFERELIRARTGEGRARAVANGVKMGRKPKLTPHQKREAIRRRDRGEESLAEIGRSYNVSGWTISRLTT